MKSTIDKDNTFKPITLTITIETEDELKALWNRFNIVNDSLNDTTGKTAVELPAFSDYGAYTIYEQIDVVCRELGLR